MKVYKELLQGTEEWFKKKLGVVTGTVLVDIMGTPYKRSEVLYEIIAEPLLHMHLYSIYPIASIHSVLLGASYRDWETDRKSVV